MERSKERRNGERAIGGRGKLLHLYTPLRTESCMALGSPKN